MAGQVTTHYQDDSTTLLTGDCRAAIATLPPQSVDCVVTSPPYAMQRASTYGGIPEKEYPAWSVSVFDQIRRVLKPSGSVLWNISPHVKDAQIADYVLRMRLAIRDAGWLEHDELVWVKPDKMPTGQPTWPVRAWEPVYWYSQSKHPYCDAQSTGNLISDVQRARYQNRKSPFQGRDARLGWEHLPAGSGKVENERSRSKNWLSIAVASIGAEVEHPAPFPTQLADWLVQMFSPAGGTVLDPFSGSATTGLAASRHGRKYVGIDLDPKYHDLALRTRLRQDSLLTME